MKFSITFTKHGEKAGKGCAIVPGESVDIAALTIGDATDRIEEAERYLSRLLGLTVKIESEVS